MKTTIKRMIAVICTMAITLSVATVTVYGERKPTPEPSGLTIHNVVDVLVHLVGLNSSVSSSSKEENKFGGLDYNLDGVVNIFDAIYVLECLVKLEWHYVTYYDDGYIRVDLQEREITDEILVQMVENGTIPKNTTYLDLYKNQISDISPLSQLTELDGVNLDRNRISDISPLSGLKKLENVTFEFNEVSDISALSGLSKLKVVGLTNNNITDISALSGMKDLMWLFLCANPLEDLAATYEILSGLKNLGILQISPNHVIGKTELETLEASLPKLWGDDSVQNGRVTITIYADESEENKADYKANYKKLLTEMGRWIWNY
ncbi:MAG: leucine-rich repeat domain-containing protein [Oscillospiraceae bacterium]|nr:leucine-rich repeat domain-containing protein [Oscillospiraceae bacterium]